MPWIFGYGSLIWRPDFPFVERHIAFVDHYARRFWQGSYDHRGTPEAPGRVVTLVPDPGTRCWGVVYRLPTDDSAQILAALDHRERGGYVRLELSVQTHPEAPPQPAITYVAAPDNAHYLGPADLRAMVQQISQARGESGNNRDYVLALAQHLRELGLEDEHVFNLAAALQEA